ncbi:protein translocase subunit [Quaeritorhiza haematococci]|nr:protein translocase subunit [Quaeritorhiza haematococci]
MLLVSATARTASAMATRQHAVSTTCEALATSAVAASSRLVCSSKSHQEGCTSLPSQQPQRRYNSSASLKYPRQHTTINQTPSNTNTTLLSTPRTSVFHGYPGIITTSPFQHQQTRSLNLIAEFVNSIKRQVQENKEFQQNVKLLSDETTRVAESDAMQRARAAMEKSAESTSKVVKSVSHVAGKVAEGVEKTLETPAVKKTVEAVSHVAEKTGETVQKVAEPILDTEAAKTIGKGIKTIKKDVIDSSTNHRYIEYRPREERERIRAQRMAEHPEEMRAISANPDAGNAVVMHTQSRWAQRWETFKDSNPVFQKFSAVQRSYEESDHPLVERVRDWFSSVSVETEEAQVIRAIQMVDPSFQVDKWLRDVTEFYLPEFMDAYLKSDEVVLQEWCSEQLFAQLKHGIEAQRTQGLISDCQILDMRRVEVMKYSLLENEVPIIMLTYNTQEILLFRNKKGEIALGTEDNIEHARYAVVFTKDQCVDPTAKLNPRTNGWRIIEAQKLDTWRSI